MQIAIDFSASLRTCIKCKEDRPHEDYRNGQERFILCLVCRDLVKRNKRKVWREKNKDRITRLDKEWKERNKEKVAVCDKKRREKNKDVLARRSKAWREASKEHIWRYIKDKGQADPLYRLSRSIRTLICNAFKIKNIDKAKKTTDILGCDIPTLKRHIESQFMPDMGWHNRSEWHIDHIVPLASAKTEQELYRLNHYTNLQPLWAKDNLVKGARHTDVA